MVTQEWTLTSKDGLRLAARGWAVESPKAAVALVHGHGEHSMRYRHVADFFAANNLSTYAFDHRGHGISEGKRGHSPNYDSILGDVGDFVDQVKEKNRDLPIFVYGHSMGGNLVLNYGHNRPAGVKGVVCSSPWIRLAFAPPKAKVILANVLESIYPSLTLSSGLDSRSLSHDGAVCDAYSKDPLVHDLISVSLYNSMDRAGAKALANADQFGLPLFLFHGSEDKLTSFEASQEFAKKANDNVTFKPWEGLYHETHNEPQKQQVLEAVMNWINVQLL